MIKPFTYEDEPWPVRDNIALVQALERCSAAYRNRCLTDLCGERLQPVMDGTRYHGFHTCVA
jgi:hypothetical protein